VAESDRRYLGKIKPIINVKRPINTLPKEVYLLAFSRLLLVLFYLNTSYLILPPSRFRTRGLRNPTSIAT
jgi:hypothetical protein